MAERRSPIAAFVAQTLVAMPLWCHSARAEPPPLDPPPFGSAEEPSAVEPGSEASPDQEQQIGGTTDAYSDTDPGALVDFRGALDPHGNWSQDPVYGSVWAPAANEVGPDFRPYVSAGHWAYDSDYVWVSDYSWGWVPFHYGRWQWVRGVGWAWIPGRVYAGAWVVWRLGNAEFAYVGWAPLPPAWAWRDGIAVGLPSASRPHFVFCPSADVFAPAVGTRLATGEDAALLDARSRPYVPSSTRIAGAAVAVNMQVAAGPVPAGAATDIARPFGSPFARVAPQGPPPALLGVTPTRIVHVSAADNGIARARQFARPLTAQALGSHPPVPQAMRPVPWDMPRSAPKPVPARAVPRHR